MIVKLGPTVVSETEGRHVDKSYITVRDIDKIIETEQFLEKILGLRVHLMESPE